MFKTQNEYLIEVIPNHHVRYICKKVIKDKKGDIISIDLFNILSEKTSNVDINTAQKYVDIKEPITNVEFFNMYTNWYNFYKEGCHQDLVFAESLYKKIKETLNQRSHVIYASGFFTDYDNQKLNYLMEQYEKLPNS